MEEEYKEIDNAKIENCDIGFDDHGLFLMFTRFIYIKKGRSTGSQGIGYVIDEEFIKRFIRACGVQTLFQCNGITVKVEHTSERINKIIPLSKDRDKDIRDKDIRDKDIRDKDIRDKDIRDKDIFKDIFDIDKWRNKEKGG